MRWIRMRIVTYLVVFCKALFSWNTVWQLNNLLDNYHGYDMLNTIQETAQKLE